MPGQNPQTGVKSEKGSTSAAQQSILPDVQLIDVHWALEVHIAPRASSVDWAMAALGATTEEIIGKATNDAKPTFSPCHGAWFKKSLDESK